MQIQLYRYTGENNRVDKSGMISGTYTMNGYLRDQSSAINPVIRIEKTTPPTTGGYNYMYISDFDRYYFITDIVAMREDLWEIHGKVDVLYTYSTDILNSRVIIDKTSDISKANLYLNDGSFVMDSHKYNEVKQFPTGLSTDGYNILICEGGVI